MYCMKELPSLYGRPPSLLSGKVSLPVWKSSFTVQKSFPPLNGGNSLTLRESFSFCMGTGKASSLSGRISLPVWKSSLTVQKSFPPCMGDLSLCTEEFLSLYQRVPSLSGRVSLPHCTREFPFLYGKALSLPGRVSLSDGISPHCLTARKSLPSLLKPSGPIRKEIICFLRNSKILFISCYNPFKN